MFKPYGRKKRIKILSAIVILLAIIMYILSIYFKNQGSDEAVVKIGSYRIYNNEIINKYNDLLDSKLDKNLINVNRIPDQIKKSIAKEIYIERQIVKKANKIAIHRNKNVKDKIKSATNKIIVDEYLSHIIKKATSEKNIINEYKNITKQRDGKKEVLIDRITLDKQETHDIIFKKLKSTKKISIPRFLYFKKYYSTQKGYKQQYLLEQKLPFKLTDEKIYEVRDGKKLEIYLVKQVRKAEIPEFNNILKEKIKYDIYQKVINKLMNDIMKNKKITIIKNAN